MSVYSTLLLININLNTIVKMSDFNNQIEVYEGSAVEYVAEANSMHSSLMPQQHNEAMMNEDDVRIDYIYMYILYK